LCLDLFAPSIPPPLSSSPREPELPHSPTELRGGHHAVQLGSVTPHTFAKGWIHPRTQHTRAVVLQIAGLGTSCCCPLSSLRYDHRGSLSRRVRAHAHSASAKTRRCLRPWSAAAHFNQSCQLRSTFKGLLSMEAAATRPKGAGPPVARERGLYWLGLFRPHALDTAAAHARKKIALCLDTRKRGARRPVRRPAQMREVSRVGAKACTRAARKTRITRAAQRLAPRPRASQCHASP
jgi:hypothetical protein